MPTNSKDGAQAQLGRFTALTDTVRVRLGDGASGRATFEI